MKRFNEEEKSMWLEDWRGSGKSAWAYAKDNGLVPQTFVKWTKSGKESTPCFVEVSAQVIQPIPNNQEILIEKGNIKVHIPLCLGRNELYTVMEVLGRTL